MGDFPMIEFQNVSFSYEDTAESKRLDAIQNVSFTIPRGSFTALLGHNGSGKSTVAKLCNGLLKPQSGRVLVDGIDTAGEEFLIEIRKKIGIIFQNPDNQIIAAVVEDDVAFGLENLQVPQEEMRVRVDAALRAVGMFEARLREPHKLSGGQKQRVAIAGVLAMQCEAMILDESTAMLDPLGRQEVLETIETLRRERGLTALWITHFMEEALNADQVLVMNSGKLTENGTVEEVFCKKKEIDAAGLRLPPPMILAGLLRKEFPSLPSSIFTEEDLIEEILSLFQKKQQQEPVHL